MKKYMFTEETRNDVIEQAVMEIISAYAQFLDSELDRKQCREKGFWVEDYHPRINDRSVFEKVAKKHIYKLLTTKNKVCLDTDYAPEGLLNIIANEANLLEYGIFPYKTCANLRINKDHVNVWTNLVGPLL